MKRFTRFAHAHQHPLHHLLQGGGEGEEEAERERSEASRLQIPRELQEAVEWQRDKYRRYREGERLDLREEDLQSKEAQEAYARNLTQGEAWWLQELLETHGLHVILEMDPLPTNDLFYQKKPKYWDDTAWEEKDVPLLQIHIRKGDQFVEYAGREFSREEAPFDYHISLCFTNELHRFDLLRSDNGVQLGKAAYNRLRDTYNGKHVMLKGHMQRTAFYIDPGSNIQGNLPDFLADADFIRLHNAGSYADRDHHISM